MKRVYKNVNDKKVSGVCSGLAEYFNLDPTIVRIGVVVLAVVTAIIPVTIAYVACALILPEA